MIEVMGLGGCVVPVWRLSPTPAVYTVSIYCVGFVTEYMH